MTELIGYKVLFSLIKFLNGTQSDSIKHNKTDKCPNTMVIGLIASYRIYTYIYSA